MEQYSKCKKYLLKDLNYPSIGIPTWFFLVIGSFFCFFYFLGSLRFPWIQVINPTLYEPAMSTETMWFNIYFALAFALPYGWMLAFLNTIHFEKFTKLSQRSLTETFLVAPSVFFFVVFSFISWANFNDQNVFLSIHYYSILYVILSIALIIFTFALFSNIHTNEMWEMLQKIEMERFYEENQKARMDKIMKNVKIMIKKKIEDIINVKIDDYLSFRNYSDEEMVTMLHDDPEISYLMEKFWFLL